MERRNIMLLTMLSLTFNLRASKAFSSYKPNISNGLAEESRLMEHLREVLPKFTPPFDMKDTRASVNLDLYQILDVDEKNGAIMVNMWCHMYYYSKAASWDPADFGGIQMVKVSPKTFWTPDIVPLDAVRVTYNGFNQQVVRSDGLVVAWSSMMTLQLSCDFNLRKFPYDRQYCPVRLGPWLLHQDVYRAGLEDSQKESSLELSYFAEDNQWEIIKPVKLSVINVTRSQFSYDQIILHMRLKRIARFYETVLIFPNILLYAMSSMVFWLPVDSGEKISMAVTTLLAEIVTFQLISDILPATSYPFPDMLYFICVVAIHIALVTLMSVIVINIHSIEDRTKMPNWVYQLIRSNWMRLAFLKPYQPENHTESNYSNTHSQQILENPLGKIPISCQNEASVIKPVKIRRSTHSPDNFYQNIPAQNGSFDFERTKNTKSEPEVQSFSPAWQYFACLIDRLMFFVHIGLKCSIMTYFFSQAQETD